MSRVFSTLLRSDTDTDTDTDTARFMTLSSFSLVEKVCPVAPLNDIKILY